MRARFRSEGGGYVFEILQGDRVVRWGWCAGKRREALAAADAEMVEINATACVAAPELPPAFDIGGEG